MERVATGGFAHVFHNAGWPEGRREEYWAWNSLT